MPDFNRTSWPNRSPKTCAICGDFQPPFIDTFVDIAAHGHVYLCAEIPGQRPGCVGMMARMMGWHDGKEMSDLRQELQDALLRGDLLEHQLEEAKRFGIVDIEELKKSLKPAKKTVPVEV